MEDVEDLEDDCHLEYDEGIDNQWESVARLLLTWARHKGTEEHVKMLGEVISEYTKLEVVFKPTSESDWVEDIGYATHEGECTDECDQDCDRKDQIKNRLEFVADMEFAFRTKDTLKAALFQKHWSQHWHSNC